MDCPRITNGYCEKVNKRVPPLYCEKICKGEYEKYISDAPKLKPYKRPKRITQAKLFVRAMRKWTGSGFKVVHRDEYRKRLNKCKECTEKKTCPFCGCNLWAKAALKTEQCPLGRW